MSGSAETTNAAVAADGAVTPEQNRQLFDAFYALFASGIRFAAAFDPIPEALRKKTASGDFNASAALRALMRLNMKSGESVKVSDLARISGISFGWGSRIVDDLEGMGLVERVRDTADRRVVNVRLTKAGAELCQTIYDNRREPFAAALAGLTDAERTIAINFMDALAATFDKAADDRKGSGS